jgi:hypothetical protein
MNEKFMTYENKWMVDLSKVDFITMKENWENNNIHIKLHLGTKEVRLELSSLEEVEELRMNWEKANR